MQVMAGPRPRWKADPGAPAPGPCLCHLTGLTLPGRDGNLSLPGSGGWRQLFVQSLGSGRGSLCSHPCLIAFQLHDHVCDVGSPGPVLQVCVWGSARYRCSAGV